MKALRWQLVLVIIADVAIWGLILYCWLHSKLHENPPHAVIVYGKYGSYTYSAKSGFEAELHNVARSKLEITPDK